MAEQQWRPVTPQSQRQSQSPHQLLMLMLRLDVAQMWRPIAQYVQQLLGVVNAQDLGNNMFDFAAIIPWHCCSAATCVFRRGRTKTAPPRLR